MLKEHGLPADWGDITTPEMALQVLPVDDIMDAFVGDTSLTEPVFFDEFCKRMHYMSMNVFDEISFGDWQFKLEVFEEYGEFVNLNVKLEKMNTGITLLVGGIGFNEGDLEYEEPAATTKYGNDVAPLGAYAELFYKMLCDTNDNIYEWNQCISVYTPEITEPDFWDIRCELVEIIEKEVLQGYYRQSMECYDDFADFLEEFDTLRGEIDFFIMNYFYRSWDNLNLDVFHQYSEDYCLTDWLIKPDGLNIAISLCSEDYWMHHAFVGGIEVPAYIEEQLEEIERNINIWNKIIHEGGF